MDDASLIWKVPEYDLSDTPFENKPYATQVSRDGRHHTHFADDAALTNVIAHLWGLEMMLAPDICRIKGLPRLMTDFSLLCPVNAIDQELPYNRMPFLIDQRAVMGRPCKKPIRVTFDAMSQDPRVTGGTERIGTCGQLSYLETGLVGDAQIWFYTKSGTFKAGYWTMGGGVELGEVFRLNDGAKPSVMYATAKGLRTRPW